MEYCGSRFIPGINCWNALRTWWLVHPARANTPNWDLVVACRISGKPGIVLVEAKAHERELDHGGKRLNPCSSANSKDNHGRIGRAIDEASIALDTIVSGVSISRDSHYQLANRLAYSWKLASMGIPVILVYLGFIGDQGIEDVGPPFTTHQHWEAAMRAYTEGVLPAGFINRILQCGDSHMRMIIRSRPILEQSGSRLLIRKR